MADQVFNIAKGRVVEYYNRVKASDPTNAVFVLILLKVSEADGTLIDYDDFGALLGAAGNTEADFTSYARIVLDDTDLAALPAPDDTNNWYQVDLPDQTYTAATTGQNLVKAILGYDSDSTGGTDANIIPVAHYDFVATTDGTDLILQWDANGFFRAT